MDSKKDSISKKEYDFFINEERPTPTAFFKKFNCTSRKTAVSIWHSALKKVLTIREDNLKLVKIEQNYKDGKYKQAIEDYFKTSVLEKEKVFQMFLLCYVFKVLFSLIFSKFYRSYLEKH